MYRLVFVLFTLFSSHIIRAQNLNDNCENATDITQQVFHYLEFPESCNSIIGTLHNQHGLVIDSIDNPTVDDPVYSSQGCIGYKSETTDYYPDLWYKTTFHDQTSSFAQSLFLSAGDTVQVAIYYGQCGSLFQSHCFTLTYTDSTYWQGAWIISYPYHLEDNIFIQLKVPPQYHDQVQLCFSDDIFVPGVGLQYPFSYDRPAGTSSETLLNYVSHSVRMAIFPSPAGNWLSIQTNDEILAFTVSDLQGKIWFKGKSNKNTESFSVSDLPIGMYIITVRTETGIGVSKFFKE